MKYFSKNFLSVIFLVSIVLSGCSKIYKLQGDKNFENLAFYKAVTNYEKVLAKKQDPECIVNSAICYRKMNDYKKAEEMYAKVVALNGVDPIHRLSYAKVLINNGKLDLAEAQLESYLKDKPADISSDELLRSIRSRDELMKDTTQWSLTPVKMSGIKEYFNMLRYKDGYIFSGLSEVPKSKQNPGTGKSYYDLYFVKKDGTGKFTTPMKLEGRMSSELHDGVASLAANGQEIYYTTANLDSMDEDERFEKVIGLKIQKDIMKDGKWEKGEDFPFNNSAYSTGHPSLTADGKVMYFISDKPGGQGGTDIYVSKLTNGNWSAPENLGGLINTPENEMFPFVDSTGNLYFSSFGHKTMGGLDVFVCYNNMGVLSAPENLNYPLNSSKDDFAFSVNSQNSGGFVSSNRNGADMIYEFVRFEAKLEVLGTVLSKDGKPLAGVKVDITNKKTGAVITVFTDDSGSYKAMIDANSDFDFALSKEGYFAQTLAVSTAGKKGSFRQDFTLEDLVLDKSVVIDQDDPDKPRPIFFDFEKWDIRPDAYPHLDKLAKMLTDNPNVTIELSSHTDSRGTTGFNERLSEKRAESTKKYLVKKGVKSKRIKARGYGETKLVNGCSDDVDCTAQQHQDNRRTEFKVIRIDKK